jgi:serine acetyltransferase
MTKTQCTKILLLTLQSIYWFLRENKFVNDCLGVVACTTASFTPAATGVQGRIYSEIGHGVFAKHGELHSTLVSNLRLIGD